jgi:lipoate-protein ligase A
LTATGGWRLLRDGAADGPWNMAVDALLLERATRGIATLRLYGWRGAWLSLGYAQRLSDPRREACRRTGVGVVRRITGGRAVLHGGDLTYAVAAPEVALPSGLQASYGLVTDVLLAALGGLGITAERGRAPGEAGRADAFDCFAEPAPEEICVGGGKLCGSAQRRSGGALLQHGSLRLRPDPSDLRSAALGGVGPATSLYELGFEGGARAVEDACISAFEAAFGPCTAAPLGPADRHRVCQLSAGAPGIAGG